MTLALLPRQDSVDLDDAHEFLEQFHAETNPAYPLRRRLRRVRAEIDRTGTYVHTEAEVAFGARVAWRNAARCTGRLYWHGLHVRDRRAVRTPSAVADECAAHLRECTRGGRIRSTITVFAPDRPGHPGPRIVNDQLIRYAGHRTSMRQMELGKDTTGEAVGRALLARTQLYRKVQGWFTRFDVVVTPTLTRTAIHIEERLFEPIEIEGRKTDTVRKAWYPYTHPFNLTGHPALTLPCGFHGDGLPMAIQLVGRRGEDARLLRVAALYEQARPWAGKRPRIPGLDA